MSQKAWRTFQCNKLSKHLRQKHVPSTSRPIQASHVRSTFKGPRLEKTCTQRTKMLVDGPAQPSNCCRNPKVSELQATPNLSSKLMQQLQKSSSKPQSRKCAFTQHCALVLYLTSKPKGQATQQRGCHKTRRLAWSEERPVTMLCNKHACDTKLVLCSITLTNGRTRELEINTLTHGF